ncbi:MAG: histone deacetylase [Pseudomonadota bacterium]
MIPLVHHPDYDAASVGDDHRFPMRKYSKVAAILRGRGAEFVQPTYAPAEWLSLAHEPGYVSAVLSQTVDRPTTRKIGFEITDAIARRTRASVAGTALAARLALEHGAAANLAGGSHHASYRGGAGFCVFNDVAVAAKLLLAEGAVRRILVVDCDVHHGDGTAVIFSSDPAVYTFSLHCEANWPRAKPPSDLDVGLAKGAGDDVYLEALDRALATAFEAANPDLVFYNAGVDPHADDRLGLLALSDAGLRRRDARVARQCKSNNVPICGVLGGGYSKDIDALAARHCLMVESFERDHV